MSESEIGRRIFNTGRVMVGAEYEPPERVQDMGYHAEAVQRALLDWHSKSANDSRIMGSSRDLHRVSVGKRSIWWHLMRWLRSPRAW